jgi:hypothetical protein
MPNTTKYSIEQMAVLKISSHFRNTFRCERVRVGGGGKEWWKKRKSKYERVDHKRKNAHINIFSLLK